MKFIRLNNSIERRTEFKLNELKDVLLEEAFFIFPFKVKIELAANISDPDYQKYSTPRLLLLKFPLNIQDFVSFLRALRLDQLNCIDNGLLVVKEKVNLNPVFDI